MAIITVHKPKPKVDGMCADIRCNEMLGPYDIKNGRRFCRQCRGENRIPLWKCAICSNIISGCTSRQTRKFCDNCKGFK